MDRLSWVRVEDLQAWAIEAREKAIGGRLPNYIPWLNQANPEALAVQIRSLDARVISVGNERLTFPLMSVIKPFLLLYLLIHKGTKTVFDRVGKNPSNYPFYSLEQLRQDNGFPRNPMLNSGALALADLLPGETARARCEILRLWLNTSGNCQLFLDEPIAESVFSLPNPRNRSLVEELEARGYVKNSGLALETYNYICCLSGTVSDLSKLGIVILNSPESIRSIVLEIMTTCGLYEDSIEFSKSVGFPTKSGVSGVVLSAIENEGSIVCYSPPLDDRGNPIAGLYFLRQIARSIQ